ncbi:hypothetical protein H5U69_23420 [Escherichia coli]|nr:hypothetical protein [Escherichia coli]MBZ9281303.1 hypothetical protein [Escherichia coli]MBZ9285900.1 hypothetical protein [Escherichia coli]
MKSSLKDSLPSRGYHSPRPSAVSLWLYHDSGDAGLTHLYRMRDAQLWSHIEFHPECNAIYAALD